MLAKKMLLILILVSFVLISGCTERQPVTEIVIPGHGDQVYTFAHDIYDSAKVPVNDPQGIGLLFAINNRYTIVFDGSDSQDNAYFRVVLINLGKLPIYYAYEGRMVTFDYLYYIDDQWYNETDGEIGTPVFENPVLWLIGPSTGAEETSLTLEDNIIYLQGTSYDNLTMAGDKLTLLVFGFDDL